jgi:hypothetical protein
MSTRQVLVFILAFLVIGITQAQQGFVSPSLVTVAKTCEATIGQLDAPFTQRLKVIINVSTSNDPKGAIETTGSIRFEQAFRGSYPTYMMYFFKPQIVSTIGSTTNFDVALSAFSNSGETSLPSFFGKPEPGFRFVLHSGNKLEVSPLKRLTAPEVQSAVLICRDGIEAASIRDYSFPK